MTATNTIAAANTMKDTNAMTATKAIEYRIVRKILAQSFPSAASPGLRPGVWIDRLIAVVAATAGLFALGAMLQELLWVAIAAAVIVVLAAPGNIP